MEDAGVRRRRTLHFMLVAGEPSGDALGGALMCALRSATDGDVRFTGVGGAEMEAEGLRSLFPMAELSLMGLAEVAPRVPALRRRLREGEQHARSASPDVLVTIDAPAFNFRLARRLRGSPAPIVHYVAPQVWAWGAGRAARIAPILDHLLALLPFEPPLFEAVGLPCTFVGHPVVASGADCGDGERFRIRHGIASTEPVLAVLPGSRRSETARLLPPFAAALSLLADAVPGLRAAVPVVPALAVEVAAAAAQWRIPATIVQGAAEKYDALAASDAALAASGTVALELALAGVPMVTAYRMHPLTWQVARRVTHTPYVNLVNVLCGRGIAPELLQGACRPEALAAAIRELLVDGTARAAQVSAAGTVAKELRPAAGTPSQAAAETVLRVVATRRAC